MDAHASLLSAYDINRYCHDVVYIDCVTMSGKRIEVIENVLQNEISNILKLQHITLTGLTNHLDTNFEMR